MYICTVFFSTVPSASTLNVLNTIVLKLIRPVLALILLAHVSTGATLSNPPGSIPDQDFARKIIDGELSSEEKGLAIFTEADRLNSGYQDLQVALKMILVSAKGSKTERALRIQQFEVQDDGDKVLVVFDLPASIRGTALLSHAHIRGDDDQWLFLPALKRTKKIASRNKTGPFVGSEFSFEDLSPQEVEKYDYVYVGEEEINGTPCFVVDRTPRDKYSGYSRQRVWLDQAALRIQKIDFYDRAEIHAKQLVVEGYALYNDQFWKPAFMRMDNLRTRKSTELHWENYLFAAGLDEARDFSVNSLRRAR